MTAFDFPNFLEILFLKNSILWHIHYVAVVHMASDKCRVSNIGIGTHSAVCRFFCPTSKDAFNVGTQTMATAECLLPMLGYLIHRIAGSLHHQHWLQHALHIAPNIFFQHWTQHSMHRVPTPSYSAA